jgi:hypothetical protein
MNMQGQAVLALGGEEMGGGKQHAARAASLGELLILLV